jgi:hypothetical protein
MPALRISTPPTSVSARNGSGDADADANVGAEAAMVADQAVRARPRHVASLQQSRAEDKRQAIRMALDIITAVSKGLYVPNSRSRDGHQPRRIV